MARNANRKTKARKSVPTTAPHCKECGSRNLEFKYEDDTDGRAINEVHALDMAAMHLIDTLAHDERILGDGTRHTLSQTLTDVLYMLKTRRAEAAPS